MNEKPIVEKIIAELKVTGEVLSPSDAALIILAISDAMKGGLIFRFCAN